MKPLLHRWMPLGSLFLLGWGGLGPNLTAGSPPTAAPGACVKVEVYRNLILMPVELENGTSCIFLLDTGAATSIVDTKLADKLNISIHGTTKMRGVGGEVEGQQVRPQFLRIGSILLERPNLVSLPMSGVSAGLGREIHGLLGWDILRRFVVEIDYAAARVVFHEPTDFDPPSDVESMPLTDAVTPLIRAHLLFSNHDPAGGLFQLDTGFSSAIRVNRDFTDRHKLLQAAGPTVEDQALGTGGTETIRRGRAVGLQSGRFVISHPIVSFYRERKSAPGGERSIGNLGGEFLRRFKITLDAGGQRLWLEPTSALTQMDELDMTGLRLVATGNGLQTVLVSQVLGGSPAARAGIRNGDELTRVNGKPADKLGLDGILALGKAHGGELVVEYRRKGRTNSVTLKLSRQI
ncbi:MAG: aspartyl protease family protein [Opitutaceae bacterium]|nr:aspartyl protease family protein [Verrucomicrobiales bacterium]